MSVERKPEALLLNLDLIKHSLFGHTWVFKELDRVDHQLTPCAGDKSAPE